MLSSHTMACCLGSYLDGVWELLLCIMVDTDGIRGRWSRAGRSGGEMGEDKVRKVLFITLRIVVYDTVHEGCDNYHCYSSSCLRLPRSKWFVHLTRSYHTYVHT